MLFVMIEALRLAETDADVIAVATVQEEVGLRGAQAAAFGVDPDIGVGLDITLANDIPGSNPEAAVTKVGAGVAIKYFDSSQVPNRLINDHLRELAERDGITWQAELLPRGGTDAGAIQRTRAGVATTTISVPVRYVHTVNESASITDIEQTIRLLAAFLNEASLDRYRWA
jgi:endoglucanase